MGLNLKLLSTLSLTCSLLSIHKTHYVHGIQRDINGYLEGTLQIKIKEIFYIFLCFKFLFIIYLLNTQHINMTFFKILCIYFIFT